MLPSLFLIGMPCECTISTALYVPVTTCVDEHLQIVLCFSEIITTYPETDSGTPESLRLNIIDHTGKNIKPMLGNPFNYIWFIAGLTSQNYPFRSIVFLSNPLFCYIPSFSRSLLIMHVNFNVDIYFPIHLLFFMICLQHFVSRVRVITNVVSEPYILINQATQHLRRSITKRI